MTAHTPGPWETGRAAWDEDGDVMYSLHGIKVATVADCRLIGAAPDLLEALKLAGQSAGFQYMTTETRSKIDDAIAKAEARL
ncbi:hypothetical protein GOD90_10835 [Sinorhizobium medicae]|nr:hypothetical protein [Sinorhizobium medicae]